MSCGFCKLTNWKNGRGPNGVVKKGSSVGGAPAPAVGFWPNGAPDVKVGGRKNEELKPDWEDGGTAVGWGGGHTPCWS
jgi:hypothetical protein